MSTLTALKVDRSIASLSRRVPKNWRPSVHYIEKQDAIMVVALDERPSRITLIFYDTKDFYEIQRIKVQRVKFDCAMIVNEL